MCNGSSTLGRGTNSSSFSLGIPSSGKYPNFAAVSTALSKETFVSFRMSEGRLAVFPHLKQCETQKSTLSAWCEPDSPQKGHEKVISLPLCSAYTCVCCRNQFLSKLLTSHHASADTSTLLPRSCVVSRVQSASFRCVKRSSLHVFRV